MNSRDNKNSSLSLSSHEIKVHNILLETFFGSFVSHVTVYRVYVTVELFSFFNRPTLQFSESTVSDISPPESINLSREESHLSLEPLYFNSISRSSSERSGTGAKDILMSPLGEATEFLPIKIIAPEMQADIQELLTPIFDDYHRVMVSKKMQ